MPRTAFGACYSFPSEKTSASSTQVVLSKYYRNWLDPQSQPFDAIHAWFYFWLNLLPNMAGSVVSYFRNWDLQLLCSAFVVTVTGSILSNKPFRIYALRFLLSKLVASSAWLV